MGSAISTAAPTPTTQEQEQIQPYNKLYIGLGVGGLICCICCICCIIIYIMNRNSAGSGASYGDE